MKSVRKGDVVLYETNSGRRRLGLVVDVRKNDYPPVARIRPYIGGRQEYGGRAKVPLSAIVRRASDTTRHEIEMALVQRPMEAPIE